METEKWSTADPLLATYLKSVGTYDVMSRNEEIARFKELGIRARECISRLAEAPLDLREDWASGEEEDSEEEDGRSDAVIAAESSWRGGRTSAKKFVLEVMKNEDSKEWALEMVKTISASDWPGSWADSMRSAFMAYSAVRSHIVNANLRFVITVAKKYHRMGRHSQVLDLIQDGNIGLMRSVSRFDVDRGYKFSTYAMWWIRHHIQRAISEKEKAIRIPVHTGTLMAKLSLIAQKRSLLGLPVEENDLAEASGTPLKKVRSIIQARHIFMSAESHVGDSENTTFLDMMEDPTPLNFMDQIHEDQLRKGLEKAMARLSKTERDVIRKRFNLGGDPSESKTLQEIASEYDLTRERIRQIECKAMMKLRRDSGKILCDLRDQ